MPGFWEAVLTMPFLKYALLGGLLGSVAGGIVGTYIVSRRITYLVAAVAHFVLGGIGVARYLALVHGLTWFKPFYGAVISSLVGAAIVAWAERFKSQRQDVVIGAVWTVGMAVGIIAISATPGYNEDLVGYLFGNIFFITPLDLYFIFALDLFLVAILFFLYRQILCLCFDREWALLRGVSVDLISTVLLGLTALTVVCLLSMVGVLLVIALLSLPAAIAGRFARTLKSMIVVAIVVSAAFCTGGLWASYELNLPPGASIVMLAAMAYAGSSALGSKRIWGRSKSD